MLLHNAMRNHAAMGFRVGFMYIQCEMIKFNIEFGIIFCLLLHRNRIKKINNRLLIKISREYYWEQYNASGATSLLLYDHLIVINSFVPRCIFLKNRFCDQPEKSIVTRFYSLKKRIECTFQGTGHWHTRAHLPAWWRSVSRLAKWPPRGATLGSVVLCFGFGAQSPSVEA